MEWKSILGILVAVLLVCLGAVSYTDILHPDNPPGNTGSTDFNSIILKENYVQNLTDISKTDWDKQDKKKIKETFQEAEYLKMKNKHIPGFIAVGGITFETTVIKQDELSVEIEQLSNTDFILFASIYNETKVNKLDYKFKVILNVSGKLTILKEKLTKKDISKGIYFTVPDGTKEFRLSIGESSTQVVSSGGTANTLYGGAEKICMSEDGNLNIVYVDSGQDLWYGNSADGGATWDLTELSTVGYRDTNIVCRENDNLFIASSYLYKIYIINSTDGGDNWGSVQTVQSGGFYENYAEPFCVVDKNDFMHCVLRDDYNDILYYINETDFTTLIDINTNTGDDTDQADIVVDSNGVIWIAGIGSDQDDLDIWTSDTGWGDSNRIEVYDGGTYTTGNEISMQIEVIDNIEKIFINFVVDADLILCNSTVDTPTTWSCTTVDSSASFSASLGVNLNNNIQILYGEQQTDSGEVYRSNSTDGVTFDARTEMTATAGSPRLADQYYPSFAGMTDVVNYIYEDANNVWFNNYSIFFSENYTLYIVGPTTASSLDVATDDDISINFSVIYNDVNVTSGVTIDNVTIDSSLASILSNNVCSGTLDCSGYSVESTCNNCSQCSWGVASPDYTAIDCDTYWSSDCSATPDDGDNTIDDCDSWGTYSGYGYVDNSYLNITTAVVNDDVKLSCYIGCYSGSTEYELWVRYPNTTWEQLISDNCANSADENVSVTITDTSATGTYYARCIADYYGADNSCAVSNYHDNDDLSFDIIGETCNAVEAGSCSSCSLDECDTNCSDAGCTQGTEAEFGFDGSFWQINVTVPSGTGLVDLFLNATYNGVVMNHTQTEAINYNSAISMSAGYCNGITSIDYDHIILDNDPPTFADPQVVNATGQTGSQCLINITNTGTSSGNLSMKITEVNENKTDRCYHTAYGSNGINLSTTYQEFKNPVDADEQVLIWCERWINSSVITADSGGYRFNLE